VASSCSSTAKGLTEADAKQRLEAQLPLDDKLVYADTILDNSADLGDRLDDHNELQAPEWTKGLQKQTPLALRIQVDRMVARWVDSYSGLGSLRWLLQWLMPPIGLLAGAWRAWSRTATVKSRLASGHKPNLPSSKL
jgi:dephospho-CoA kinase